MASNWVPNSGYAKAWPSQNIKDATYLEVSYRWDSESDLSTLTGDPDSTLEPDLVFYNYDGNAMCTDWYDGNYACNTNQPRAYMDTSAFDNSDEPVFTIGCSSVIYALIVNTFDVMLVLWLVVYILINIFFSHNIRQLQSVKK